MIGGLGGRPPSYVRGINFTNSCNYEVNVQIQFESKKLDFLI